MQLAGALGVPREVIEKPPSVDLGPSRRTRESWASPSATPTPCSTSPTVRPSSRRRPRRAGGRGPRLRACARARPRDGVQARPEAGVPPHRLALSRWRAPSATAELFPCHPRGSRARSSANVVAPRLALEPRAHAAAPPELVASRPDSRGAYGRGGSARTRRRTTGSAASAASAAHCAGVSPA